MQAGEAGVLAAQRTGRRRAGDAVPGLRALQQRLVVAQESLANQRETQRIVRPAPSSAAARRWTWRAPMRWSSTEVSLPALQGAIERNALRIATLAGRTPRATLALLAEAKPLPSLPATTPSRSPSARRPACSTPARHPVAERQLAAATAAIGVARAPISTRASALVGLLGFTSTRAADLFDAAGPQHQPRRQPELERARLRPRAQPHRRQRGARAGRAGAVGNRPCSCARGTEGALSSYTRSVQQSARLENAARNPAEAARAGACDATRPARPICSPCSTPNARPWPRATRWCNRSRALAALVAVYRAGGGWTLPA